MNRILAGVLMFLTGGALFAQQEFVNFRPEISTGITKAVMSEDTAPINPDDEDLSDCPCNKSTGMITHGDGHRSKCPCTSGECGCVNNSGEEPKEIRDVPVPITVSEEPVVGEMVTTKKTVTYSNSCATGSCGVSTSTEVATTMTDGPIRRIINRDGPVRRVVRNKPVRTWLSNRPILGRVFRGRCR